MADSYGLEGTWLRHERAGEHLAYIQKALQVFREGNPYPILPYEDTDALPQDPWDLMASNDPRVGPSGFEVTRDVRLTPRLSLRIGEMVYNLRAALDYLIFALAWHDTGKRPTGKHERLLQFPIEDRVEGFRARRNTLLKGLTDESVAIVESYQPYKGRTWTAGFREISNADKHRHLMLLAGAYNTYEMEYFTSLGEVPEAKRARARSRLKDGVDVGLYATLDVTFEDGTPVAETLDELHTQVGQLLKRFRKLFTLPPVD